MTRLEQLMEEAKNTKPLPIVGKLDMNDESNEFFLSQNDYVYVRNSKGEFSVDFEKNLRESKIDLYANKLPKDEVDRALQQKKRELDIMSGISK